MTEPWFPAGTRWWHTLIVALSAAALSIAAWLVMLSAFMYYDDEGYVLMSFRNFAEHGGLYREVFTQYGPFPYAFHAMLHQFGLPFTHLAGRLVTLVAWAGAAVLAAALVREATRSLPVTLAVLAATFCYLWVMASEPSHPGGLVTLITALMAAIGYRLIARDRVAGWAILAGATVAALALTKINVGGFAGLSALVWMLLHARNAALRRWAPGLAIAGAALLPLGLMRPLLDSEWVQMYALVFAVSAISAIAVSLPGTRSLVGLRTLRWSVAAGLAMTAAVVGLVVAKGTGVADLLNGVVIRPLQHPTSFSLGYRWPAGAMVFASGSFLLCGVCIVLRGRGAALVDVVVASLRLAAAIGIAAAMIRFPASSPERLLFAFIAPSVWLFLWPLAGEDRAAVSARLWLGLLFLGQFLHAFPVAGSQMAWGTFLILPLAGAGGAEAARWLRRRSLSLAPGWRVSATGLNALVVLVALWLGMGLGQVGARYRDGSDLRLPGAELLRLPSESAALFQILSINAAAHASVLFSEPGMLSLNLWSGVRTPTLANATHWFSLLDRAEQQRIIGALDAEPDACVIVQRGHIEYLERLGFAPAGVLHDYIARNFTPVFVLDGFEFCVRNGRAIAPVMLGEMRLGPEEDTQPGGENTILEMLVLLPPGRAVERIEVFSAADPTSEPLVFSQANARLEATPTDLVGRPFAARRTVPWPLQLDSPALLSVFFDRHAEARPVAGALITFRGPDGDEIALARLSQQP